MIRVILFLALVGLVALGVVWVADRPGEVAITWQGYRIETSVMVTAAAIAMVVVVALLLWSLVRTILRSPDLIAMFLGHRRGVRGYLAISRGLVSPSRFFQRPRTTSPTRSNSQMPVGSAQSRWRACG